MATSDRLRQNAVADAAGAFSLHFEPSLPSTSTHAEMLLVAGRLAAPAVVTTNHQITGRGQFDRIWHGGDDEPSGIAATFVFPCLPIPLQHLPLIVAVLVRRLLGRFVDDVRIKWPNDLMRPGGKVAGILCERKLGHDLIGIGINVQTPHDLPPGITASGLNDDDASPSRIAVFAGLCKIMAGLPDTSLDSVREEYEQHHLLTGKSVEVTKPDGTRVTGWCHGISPDGYLRVAEMVIHSGSVQIPN